MNGYVYEQLFTNETELSLWEVKQIFDKLF